MLGYDLDIVLVQIEFMGDLPVRQVEPHEVETKHPDPKRLVMSGQNGAGQIVEAALARCTDSVTMPLRVIMPMASHRGAVTVGATDTLGPPMPAHQS